jgi:peroxiredoxin
MRQTLLLGSFLLLSACGGPQTVRSTYADGKLAAEGQTAGKKQFGPWIYYHPSGAIQASGAWDNDKQVGPWQWFFSDGRPQFAGAYVAGGLRDGTWKAWHANGKLASEGAYQFDRQNGGWRYWHDNGAVFAEGTFDYGVKHGWWITRTSAGMAEKSGLFIKGLKVGPWTTWSNGVARVEDLGVPAGAVANWSGRTWSVSGVGLNGSLTFAADGTPSALQLSNDGRTFTSLPSDVTGFTVDLAGVIPTAPVDAPASAPTAPPISTAPTIALTHVVSPVPASAPITPAAEAQIESASVGLSPLPVNPAVFSQGDRAHIELLLRTYTSGKDPLAGSEYAWGTDGRATGDPAGRQLLNKMLPQTRFLSSTGAVIDLARLKKPVVLCVMRGFSGQVCIYCATQTAAIANNYSKFTAAGAEVVIIYPGPTEAVPAFVTAVQSLRKDPPPMPIGLDVSLLLVRGLGVEENLAKPTSLIIDTNGKIAYAYIGASMADRPSVEDLLQALRKVVK